MATTITDNYGKIDITIGSTSYSINKSDIESMDMDVRNERLILLVKRGTTSGVRRLHISLDDVSSPSVSALNELHETLHNYWFEPGKDFARFIASAGDTVFDCSPRIVLSDNSKVFIDGTLTRRGYTKTGNAIVFSTAMTGNEDIIIKEN